MSSTAFQFLYMAVVHITDKCNLTIKSNCELMLKNNCLKLNVFKLHSTLFLDNETSTCFMSKYLLDVFTNVLVCSVDFHECNVS